MNKLILTVLLTLVQCNYFVAPTEKLDKLLAVAVYFRHGDRSPAKSFPTDQFFTLDNFPMGFGQLTNKGINRHYELGQWFRDRYSTFLPEQYSPKDILVMSTDVDRTLMSAAANLAGLYPPRGWQVWNKDLPWRPTPIHTVARADDNVLAMKKSCPRWDKLYDESKSSEFYQQIDKEHAELYEYVSEQSGLNVTSTDEIRLIRSIFYCYRNFNESFIPSWAETLNQTELDYLAGLTYAGRTATGEMKRLRAGPFFNYLISYFYDVSNNVENKPKFLMFSSHDTELVSVLDAMGVNDISPVSFAATIIWEVKETTEGSKYVNLFYRKSDDELLNLTVPGCAFDCQLDDFKVLLEPVTVNPEKWEEECNSENSK
ncbi:lysosomal acid phosphatase [Anoplophora glabripennis]|uniref:lysosomal acid phosphatase n=1 Tax=Anoplophora glabripennis TaxID=217634 RepID=UPI000874825D|nr:lysosomal acid phosphatase [Anoplophora glabripennis]